MTTTENAATLTLTATAGRIAFSARFATRSEAEAFAAIFPKSAKFWVSAVSNMVTLGDDYFSTSVNIVTGTNGVNGGKNETGIRRYRSIIRAAEKAGVAIEYRAPYSNSLATRQALEATF